MKRTLLCALLALSLLLNVGCGSPSAPAASSNGASSGTVSSAPDASSDVDLDSVPTSTLLNYSIGLLGNGFFEGIRALDYVTLPKLEGIAVPKAMQSVTEDELQAAINSMLEGYVHTEEIRDRAVKDGDLVNIDYVGRINGVAFDGGNTQGNGTVVTAGSAEYIDDFLTQIIGAKPGETVMVEVTFPTPYSNPDLSGKDAVFETVINYIVGDTITPELTDAFVKENLQSSYGYTGVEDLKAKLKEQLSKDQLRTYLLEMLRSQSTIREVPQKLITDQENFMLANLKNQAAYNNMTLNMLLSYYGWTTLGDAYASQREGFEQYIQEYMVCQAVAETLNIRIDEETAREYFTEISGGGNYDAYAAYYGKGYIGQDVLVSKVGDYLLDNALFQ